MRTISRRAKNCGKRRQISQVDRSRRGAYKDRGYEVRGQTGKIWGLEMNLGTLGKCWTTPSRRKKREESDKERGHRTGGWDVRSEVWG